MDKTPERPDELSELERRLSAWEPTATGLDTEAMLFAAGRAAARPGPVRFVWPALTGMLTILAIGLGLWLGAERAERQLLAEQLRQQSLAASPAISPVAPSVAIPTEPPSTGETSPDSLLSARRALEHGLDAWKPRVANPGNESDPPPPDGLVMRVGQPYALLDP